MVRIAKTRETIIDYLKAYKFCRQRYRYINPKDATHVIVKPTVVAATKLVQ